MLITPPLIPATLIKRYKRFLGDVVLSSGQQLTVHTPNTGAMTGCAEPGSRIWLRDTQSVTRKYQYSWEVSETPQGAMVGVHTGIVNQLVSEAIQGNIIQELQGYTDIRQEVRYGNENSRIDLLLQNISRVDCYIEIKNVTAVDNKGIAFFPDAVSKRATKHCRELLSEVKKGNRGVIFFCIQRNDVKAVRPADEVDAEYGKTLREVVQRGVEVIAYKAMVTADEISLYQAVPVII